MSSNKSAHLGLHLWQPEDHFLRTEFNENSVKLDEAAGAARYVTLLDVTTTAAAKQVDLDVSGIDFTSLWEAELFCDAYGGSSANDVFLIRTNGAATGYWQTDPNKYASSGGTTYWGSGPLGGARRFKLLTDNPDSTAILDYTTAHFGPENIYSTTFIIHHKLCGAPVRWSGLHTINMVRETGSFAVGTRFYLRGVRR